VLAGNGLQTVKLRVGSVPAGNSTDDLPSPIASEWSQLETEFRAISDKHPKIALSNNARHLGTLGTGNHFIEVCLDEADRVWFMLHSGSRGVGGRIGQHLGRVGHHQAALAGRLDVDMIVADRVGGQDLDRRGQPLDQRSVDSVAGADQQPVGARRELDQAVRRIGQVVYVEAGAVALSSAVLDVGR